MLPPAFSASACIILLGLNEPTQPLLLSSPACRGMPPPDFLTMPGFPYRRLSGDLVEGVLQAPHRTKASAGSPGLGDTSIPARPLPAPLNSFLCCLPGQFVPFRFTQPYPSLSPGPEDHRSSKCALPAGVFARVLSPTPQETTPTSTNSCSSGLISWPP